MSWPVEPTSRLDGPAMPPAPGPPLTGFAAEIRVERLQALLVNRPPDCLTDPDTLPLVVETMRGIASEVAAVTGDTPGARLHDMAVWAVVLGTAASLEAALFPEQQLGDSGRADQLQRRYLGVLASLTRVTTAGVASGSFSGIVHVARGGWPVCG